MQTIKETIKKNKKDNKLKYKNMVTNNNCKENYIVLPLRVSIAVSAAFLELKWIKA